MTTNKNTQKGFTLLELLVVVAILGILAAVGIPQYQGYQASAKATSTRTNHANIVSYVSSEFTKCSTGAAPTMFTNTDCAAVIGTIVTDFAAYGVAQNWNNSYSPADASVVEAAVPGAPAVANAGFTYIQGAGATLSATTYYLDADGTTVLSVSNNILKE